MIRKLVIQNFVGVGIYVLESMCINLLLLCLSFQSDSNVVSSINCALESIHAALAVMANNQMPKQLYKEEVYALH